jgi:carbonic anhydrase/acetyltransferase-like protein (isoleucine patch superfamily)
MTLLFFGNHQPRVATSAFVAPSATLIGQVSVDEDVTIMFGAVLRGDRDAISVGAGSNLQDNVVVHADPGFPTTIGQQVSVGHGAIVHGATIKDSVLIGMGAVVLNGCEIGEGSIIAAGAVVLEGEKIPPGSLVAGVPGKIRRDTTAEERSHILTNAQTYRELGAHYRADNP